MYRTPVKLVAVGVIILSTVRINAEDRSFSNQFDVVQGGRFEYYKIRSEDKGKHTEEGGDLLDSWVPRPYAFSDIRLNGNGYKALSERFGVGLNLNSTRLIVDAEIYRDNARKADSGTGNTTGGIARAFYRFKSGWYLGAGAQENKLVTSIYSKQAWRPTFGGGKDILRSGFSTRLQIVYVTPGTDRLNATQGPEFSLWLPSPAKKGHWFYRQTLAVYEFHQTSVPGDAGTQSRGVQSFLSFGVVYRLGGVPGR